MLLGIYLALRELWRGKGKFLLFSLVIGLITLLVLFVSALGEGLANSNKEYIEKLNAELLVFRENSDLSIQASSVDKADLRAIKRVEGVADAGLIGLSRVSIVPGAPGGDAKAVDVALVGVEHGRPGEPPVLRGTGLLRKHADEAIIDSNVARQAGLAVGDDFTVRSVQAATEEFYTLKVIGVTDSRRITFNPSIFVPILTWEEVKPQAIVGKDGAELVSNVVAVKLQDPAAWQQMIQNIKSSVDKVDVADLVTAYEATPGYEAQQSTLSTQRNFLLLIGVLVIGGFFQIQTLQKVPQIGMLKAIGASNLAVAIAALVQIVVVTLVGALIGGMASLGLSLVLPPTVPIVFEPGVVSSTIVYLLIIGPLGGLVSIRYALRVEPLTALGLSGQGGGAMPPILETHTVSKIYRNGGQSTRAVDNVSIQIEPGEFVALVGPSGSGKTTLLAILAGLLAPTDGVVSIDGQALSRLGEGKRARFRREKIGFTFQANNLVPYLTVLENVTLMLRLNGMYDRASRQRARDLLTRLGLEDRLNYLPRQISGGQQQRVAIARALIHLPSVVLADEPTASLDTERAVQVVETFATLIHEQNRAGVMVTHDLRMVKYVDRVIQMLDGRVARMLDSDADIACLANPADCRSVPLDVLDPNAPIRECAYPRD